VSPLAAYRRVALRCVASGVLVVVLVAGGAASAVAGTAPTPFAKDSATTILSLVAKAMARQGYVASLQTTKLLGSGTLTIHTLSAANDGTQTQAYEGGVETSRLFDRTLFMKADATAYKYDFNVASTPLANQWALVPSTNVNYKDIANGILLPSVIHETTSLSSPTIVGPTTFEGQNTIALKGLVKQGATALETVYVSTHAPYLPVGIKVIAESGSSIATDTINFSRWGTAFSLATPASYVRANATTFP